MQVPLFVSPLLRSTFVSRNSWKTSSTRHSTHRKRQFTRRVLVANLPDVLQAEADSCLEKYGLTIESSEWKPPTLVVYIDTTSSSDRSASIEDCSTATRVIGEVLDEADFGGNGGYTLEVSTPGASDILTEDHEFVAFKGFPVRISVKEQFKGKNIIQGNLVARTDGAVRVGISGRVVNVPREIVMEVKLSTAAED